MKRSLIVSLIGMLVLTSCQPKQIYTHFHSISELGWGEDSLLRHEVTVTDEASLYDVLITVRYDGSYPYQNLWMFVDEWYGELLLSRDTIECYLADDYGRWVGAGIATYELPLLYESEHRFAHPGDYRFTIQQGMRTDYLQGIKNVGLMVVYNNGKK